MAFAIHLIVVTFATLFPITNPLGNAAIFLSITEGEKRELRRNQAWKGSLYMFLILAGFFLGGSFIMQFFGISLPGIRIAGGLVITKIGFNLLTPSREATHSDEEHAEAKEKKDIAFSPLAMPLLAGPGSIATIMGMASLLKTPTVIGYASILVGIALVCLTCWLILRESELLMKVLGVNGANALTKIMGFLLLSIGVQLVIDGYLGIHGLH